MKKLQDNFTTPEQSKRLLKSGVPQDSADCYIVDWYIGGKGYNAYGDVHVPFVQYERKLRKTIWKENVGRILEPIQNGNLPCWSVGRLQEIAKICAKEKEYYYASVDAVAHQEDFVEWWVKHFTLTDNVLFDFSKLEEE